MSEHHNNVSVSKGTDARLEYFHRLLTNIATQKEGRLAAAFDQPLSIVDIRKAHTGPGKLTRDEVRERAYYHQMLNQIDLERFTDLVEDIVPPLFTDLATHMVEHQDYFSKDQLLAGERVYQREILYTIGCILSHFCGDDGVIEANRLNRQFLADMNLRDKENSENTLSPQPANPAAVKNHGVKSYPLEQWVGLEDKIIDDYVTTGLVSDEATARALFDQRDLAIDSLIGELQMRESNKPKLTGQLFSMLMPQSASRRV